MKSAKSCKIFLLLAAFVAIVASAFLFFDLPVAKAAESAQTYVTCVNSSVSFDGDGDERALVATVKKVGENDVGEITFKNNLVIDDLAIAFGEMSTAIKSVTVTVKTNSYIVTGNKNAEGKFDTTIINTIVMTHNGANDWSVKLNDRAAQAVASEITKLYIAVEDNFIGYGFDGTTYEYEDAAYYKVETIDKTVTSSGIKFDVKVDGDEEQQFKILSVDQKASDVSGDYKQTFKVNDGGAIEKYAKPLVNLNESFFTRKTDGKYYPVAYNGKQYTMSFTVYSFFGGKVSESETATASKVSFKETAGLSVYSSKKIQLNVSSADIAAHNNVIDVGVGFDANAGYIDFNSYGIEVVNKADDDTAPEYYTIADNLEAIESFEAALKDKYTAVTDNVEHSVVLGNDLELPSLKSLVYDDTSSYAEMKYTVRYYGPDSSTTGSSSSLKFNLGSAGVYTFYVSFKDANGNEMDSDDFFEIDGTDYIFGTYGAGGVEAANYVFRFKVDDDAPITLDAPSEASIGKGYVGTKYSASGFNIKASGFNTTYSLYYNPNKNADELSGGWVAVPAASDVTDEDYNENGYTYGDIQSIAYDGSLQFKPDKEGAYKITCTVSSKVTTRSESASQIIKVDGAKASVDPSEPPSTRSVLAIVFLSVGTLCLIGIVVLLFVKPKEKTEETKLPSDKK